MTSNCFLQYIAGYTVANFWRYPTRRSVTKANALELQSYWLRRKSWCFPELSSPWRVTRSVTALWLFFMVPWVSLQSVIVVFLVLLLYSCFVITMLSAQEKMSFKASTDFRQRTRTGKNQTITRKNSHWALSAQSSRNIPGCYMCNKVDEILFFVV